MGTRSKKRKKTFQPVDFDGKFQSGRVPTPPEEPKKSFPEVISCIQRELQLVSIGLSKHCAKAIQFDPNKTPFCKVLGIIDTGITSNQAQELIRLAFQDFGNKFAEFVKTELRHLF